MCRHGLATGVGSMNSLELLGKKLDDASGVLSVNSFDYLGPHRRETLVDRTCF